jgi:imidazolonepropionase-like amidohydrolase
VEALRSATDVAGERFRSEDQGEIENRRKAELFVMKTDRTQNIKESWEDEGVQQAGSIEHSTRAPVNVLVITF